MAGKAKGGLGKTARSSQDAGKRRAERAKTILPHVCAASCGKPITADRYVCVKSAPGWASSHYHVECYVVIVPKGPAAQSNHPEVKLKQTAGKPNYWARHTGWSDKHAARNKGYTKEQVDG